MKFEKKLQNDLKKLDTLPMLHKQKILEACPTVPTVYYAARVKRRIKIAKITALAMAALLLVGSGLTVLAAENKAYNEALDFFELYNLSAEGFTRSEVKKIYKDIISKSFTYEKTEEALASGLEGYEIQTAPLDPDALSRLWLTGYQYKAEQNEEKPISEYYYSYDDEMHGLPYIGTGSVLMQKKNKDDAYADRLWEIYLANIGEAKMTPTPTGAMVIGMPAYEDYGIFYKLRIYAYNDDSTEAWRKDVDCPLATPRVHYLIYDEGEITVFASQSQYNYLWIAKIDLDGNIIEQEMLDVGEKIYKIEELVQTANGYLILTSSDKVIRIADHQVQPSLSFGDGGETVEITSVKEYNGLIYISGTSTRYIVDLYEDYLEQFGEDGATDEEALQFAKDHHTAVLLLCDPASGELMSFYSIPAAAGGNLKVQDGKLNWEVQRFRSILRGQMIGSSTGEVIDKDPFLTIGDYGDIECDVWQYAFTFYGQVVGEKDTGKSVDFYM